MPVLRSDKDRCLQCDVVVDRKGRTLCISNGAICGEFLLAKTRKRENIQATASLSSEKNSIIGA
jgi:ribosomal protein L36